MPPQEASLRQEAGDPLAPGPLPADERQHGCSCASHCGCFPEGVSRHMGPGRGASRYGFPGGSIWALGEWSVEDLRFSETTKKSPKVCGQE